MQPLYHYLRFRVLCFSIIQKFGTFLPDRLYLKMLFWAKMGRRLHLDSPQSFNEKLQWLKLYDRNPLYTKMVDKSEVKQYVASIIGNQYIIPTIGVWSRVEEIEWLKLPETFVLKSTQGGGGVGVVICKDKKEIDVQSAHRELERGLKLNPYKLFREWPYKNVTPRIIAEQYMLDSGEGLDDYKIHCFNGEPKFILVCRNRFSSGLIEDFYSIEWNHLPVRRPGKPALGDVPKPVKLEEMLSIAKVLSKGIPFVRCDLYLIGGNVYFGELTFYPASGLSRFEPESYDYLFGEMLTLPVQGID